MAGGINPVPAFPLPMQSNLPTASAGIDAAFDTVLNGELGAAGMSETTTGGTFKDLLLGSIRDVNALQHQADQAVETLMTGGDVDPAQVLTAVQKADLAFRLMMQIRNKLVDAYNEVQAIRV